MSRLTGADALGLFEAYQAVYAPQELTEEQVWEEVETWVNSLLEEGYDLSDYTWEEMYESYLEEKSAGEFYSTPGNRPKPKGEVINLPKVKGAITGGDVTLNRGYASTLGGQKGEVTYQKKDNVVTGSFRPTGMSDIRGSDKPGSNRPKLTPPVAPATTDTKTNTLPTRTPAGSPSKPTPTKPTPTKPTAAPAAAQTGDKTKDMATFAKANPGLAAASAERDRTRGTSATTNPLMKDMKSRLPAPKTPSPTTSSTAFSKSTPSLGSSTPEVKSAGTSSGSAGFGKSAPSIGSSAFKPSPAAAAPTPTPTTAAATTPAAKPALKKPIVSGFDMFDVVKGYLIGEGYADTEEAALAIMINMSEEWRQSIVEERAPGVSEYKPNRLNPLPKEKPLSGKKGDGSGYGADEKFKKPDDKITKPGTEVPAPKKGGYGRIFSNIPYGIGAHANRERSRNSTIRGMDPGAPRSEKLAPTENKEKKKPSREIVRKRKDTNESYNIILSYLLDEGYANTVESAEAIISNMSEDWILSIIQ